jgi:hypothetical protein
MPEAEVRTCLICGEPLPSRPWWRRWFGDDYPAHDQQGAEGDACWLAMNQKIGNTNPGPRPS